MNITARLRLGEKTTPSNGKIYLVVGCVVHVNRSHHTLFSNSSPVCESMEITVVAPDKTDLELQEWFLMHSLRSGKLEYEIQDIQLNADSTQIREIVFEDAQCFSYREHYDIDNQSQRMLTLKIFPKEFQVEDLTFVAKERE